MPVQVMKVDIIDLQIHCYRHVPAVLHLCTALDVAVKIAHNMQHRVLDMYIPQSSDQGWGNDIKFPTIFGTPSFNLIKIKFEFNLIPWYNLVRPLFK